MLSVRGVLALSPVALSPESGVTVCVMGLVSMWLLHYHRVHGSHHELMSSHHNSLLRGFLLWSFDSAHIRKPALSRSAVRQLSSLPFGSADTAPLRYSTIASRSPADSTVAFPLATCRHCFSSGQMPWCEMP